MAFELRDVEIALLTGQWNERLDHALSASPILKLAKDVVDGSFREPLVSSYAKQLFKALFPDVLDRPFQSLFDWSLPLVGEEWERELVRLILAVSCMHAFIQINWTGPDANVKPLDVMTLPPDSTDALSDELLNAKAIAELAYGGEPAYHLVRDATFFRLAQLVLSLPFRSCKSAPWWRLRVSIVHEQILDDPVPLHEDDLSPLEQHTHAHTLTLTHNITQRAHNTLSHNTTHLTLTHTNTNTRNTTNTAI